MCVLVILFAFEENCFVLFCTAVTCLISLKHVGGDLFSSRFKVRKAKRAWIIHTCDLWPSSLWHFLCRTPSHTHPFSSGSKVQGGMNWHGAAPLLLKRLVFLKPLDHFWLWNILRRFLQLYPGNRGWPNCNHTACVFSRSIWLDSGHQDLVFPALCTTVSALCSEAFLGH